MSSARVLGVSGGLLMCAVSLWLTTPCLPPIPHCDTGDATRTRPSGGGHA